MKKSELKAIIRECIKEDLASKKKNLIEELQVSADEKEKVMDLFVYFFNEVKGHDYSDEEITMSRNEEDYEEFLDWVRECIYSYDED